MEWGTENRNKTMAAIGLMVLALLFTVVRFSQFARLRQVSVAVGNCTGGPAAAGDGQNGRQESFGRSGGTLARPHSALRLAQGQ